MRVMISTNFCGWYEFLVDFSLKSKRMVKYICFVFIVLRFLFNCVDYLTPEGHYRIDSAATKTMLNSLMYKLCYYRFGEVGSEYGLC